MEFSWKTFVGGQAQSFDGEAQPALAPPGYATKVSRTEKTSA